MSDLDQLDIMRRAITALGLGQVAPEELVASARASAAAREDARRLLSDANVRIKDLESALRDLGVNPGGDLQGEVRAITNRTAANEAAAQHDLDCALRERDAAKAKIASNVAEAAARDMRIAVLEAAVEATHKVFDGVGVAWSTGDDAGRLPLPKRAEYAVSPGFLADTERKALEARIADLERDLTTKADTLKTAHAALTRICDVIGAPIPGCPDDVVEAVAKQLGDDSDAEHRAKTAEQALKDINLALLDAGAPRAYTLDKGERPIPDADRIRILGDRVRGEWREKERVSADHSERGKIIGDAHLALDDLKAPRLADGITLTPAARIRALTR